jgi:hypothetical protein
METLLRLSQGPFRRRHECLLFFSWACATVGLSCESAPNAAIIQAAYGRAAPDSRLRHDKGLRIIEATCDNDVNGRFQCRVSFVSEADPDQRLYFGIVSATQTDRGWTLTIAETPSIRATRSALTTALFVLNIDIGGMSAAASSGSHLRAVETTFHTGADPRRHSRFNHRLAHDLGKGIPFFPRDRREAFARRSCSIQKIARDDDLKKDHPASWKQERVSLRLRGCFIGPPVRAVHSLSDTGALHLSACLILESARRFPCHSVCRRNGAILPIFARRCSLRQGIARGEPPRAQRDLALRNLDQVIRHGRLCLVRTSDLWAGHLQV